MSLKLDERLQAVASLVRPGKRIADVGADHGHLICRLVLDGVSPGGIACDIHAQPLKRADETIRAWGLEDRIKTLQTNGLQDVGPEEAEDIVIAGMGGELIWDILDAAPWVRNPDKRLVLQPMTKADRLRRALARGGFSILREVPAAAGGFCYTAMSVRYGGAALEADDLFAYCGRMAESGHPLAARYLESVRDRVVLQKARGLSAAGDPSAARYYALAKGIDGKISRLRKNLNNGGNRKENSI